MTMRDAPDPSESGEPEVALVTANFGGIDTIKPFPTAPRIATFYYTDPETLAAADRAAMASWTRVLAPNYPRHDFSPRLRGRYFKHQIHRLPEVEGYPWLAWADANVQFIDPSFLTRAVDHLRTLPPHRRLMLIAHPKRRTVREEYEYIMRAIEAGNDYLRLRYADEKMPEQMTFFKAQGWNLDAPLWCGTVWLLENSALMNRCWDAWWDQNLRFGMMDQLSLPMMLDAFGIECWPSDFGLKKNPYFHWGTHRKLC